MEILFTQLYSTGTMSLTDMHDYPLNFSCVWFFVIFTMILVNVTKRENVAQFHPTPLIQCQIPIMLSKVVKFPLRGDINDSNAPAMPVERHT